MINDIYIYCLATERDSAMPMIIVEPEMKASMNDQMLCSALSNLWLGYTHIFFSFSQGSPGVTVQHV